MTFTDGLAIYGAALSTSIFLWNAIQSRPRALIETAFAIGGDPKEAEMGVMLIVKNTSSHDLHLQSIDFHFRFRTSALADRIAHAWRFRRRPVSLDIAQSNSRNYGVSTGLPVTLEARKALKVFIPADTIKNLMSQTVDRRLKVVVSDEIGGNYSSKFFTWDLKDFL